MYLICCRFCDQEMKPDNEETHVCKMEDIKERIETLIEQTHKAVQSRLAMQNAVRLLLQKLPRPNDSEAWQTLVVDQEWIEALWTAAECSDDRVKTAEDYLQRWIAMHGILRQAFDLFRSRNGKTLVEKLQRLRNACDAAKQIFNYHDSNLDMTPEQVAVQP